jgi:uncharacterized membrane protein YeiB
MDIPKTRAFHFATAVIAEAVTRVASTSAGALGQIGLTNYLVQSMVMGFLFYGYGFSSLGRI